MRITIRHPADREQGSILMYVIVAVVLLSTIASVTAYVAQTFQIASRRESMVQALQYAEGGAAIGCSDLQRAFKTTSGTLPANVVTAGYSLNSSLSTAQTNVYQRSITAPFANQTVTAQIWMATASSADVMVIGQATVGKITQTATTHLQIKFGYGAAIISDDPGTTAAGISKSVAQDGNVVINGNKSGPIVVDGGDGQAILANGRANVATNYAYIPAAAISANQYNTANQIPDYTAEGSPDQLFDFNRFIAVANATAGPSTAANNHFTNLATFKTAVAAAKGSFLEGVVVVDINSKDMGAGLDPGDFGNYPLNLHGTLVFNFASTVKADDKIINTATMNINPADLSGLVPSNPATYTSGYPPTYINPAKNPANINIAPAGFENFTATDDLPAMMYNIGIFDIHGNVNISGVLYSPSFFEIENKQDGQIQYFKGSLITGGGILFENTKAATSIISYDSHVLDLLSTMGTKGKGIFATYWE